MKRARNQDDSKHDGAATRATNARADGPLSTAWTFVREHPIPTVGALAAGVGAYYLINRTAGGRSHGRTAGRTSRRA